MTINCGNRLYAGEHPGADAPESEHSDERDDDRTGHPRIRMLAHQVEHYALIIFCGFCSRKSCLRLASDDRRLLTSSWVSGTSKNSLYRAKPRSLWSLSRGRCGNPSKNYSGGRGVIQWYSIPYSDGSLT